MTIIRLSIFSVGIIGVVFSAAANGQQPSSDVDPIEAEIMTDPTQPDDQSDGKPGEDEMADLLNSQQQLEQTFILKRTIDGNIVETEKRTVTISRDAPYRQTEAGLTDLERVKQAFDGEVLTRVEAFEEAKLDFVIADSDRDGKMTAEEFSALVASWKANEIRSADAPTKDIERQRQYEALLQEINPEAAEMHNEAFAKQKFAFLSGASETVSREDYIREYLLDFDSMDIDGDTILRDEELMRFRALNRGETLEM